MENWGQRQCSHSQNSVMHHHTLIPTRVLSLILWDPVQEKGTSDVPYQCRPCSSRLPERRRRHCLWQAALGCWRWCLMLVGTMSLPLGSTSSCLSPSLLPAAETHCK